jgi:hypothetical protein
MLKPLSTIWIQWQIWGLGDNGGNDDDDDDDDDGNNNNNNKNKTQFFVYLRADSTA